jgi:hypothetical protein
LAGFGVIMNILAGSSSVVRPDRGNLSAGRALAEGQSRGSIWI